jgi:hypothetical protein
MSPEQLAGQPVDSRSDIYSAALVIHEALTGHLPYVSGQKLCELCLEATPSLQNLLDQCLKPNPAERPPSAVEVYLRLQELGKASGILLLPPGAIDRLVAARRENEPTLVHRPDAARNAPRRWFLITMALLLAVFGMAALVKWWFFAPATSLAEGQTLLGMKIGDDKQNVVDGLKLVKESVLNPWAEEPIPAYLGHVLRPGDLGLQPGDLARLHVQRTGDEKVCVIFHGARVVAVIARRHGAATGRGVKVDGDVNGLFERYPEGVTEVHDEKPAPGETNGREQHIEVRRYDALGIGFEVRGNRVRAITFYPPNLGP